MKLPTTPASPVLPTCFKFSSQIDAVTATTCKSCFTYAQRVAGSYECSCMPGYYRSYSDVLGYCLPCPCGTYYDNALKSCQNCPASTYNPDITVVGACLPCPNHSNSRVEHQRLYADFVLLLRSWLLQPIAGRVRCLRAWKVQDCRFAAGQAVRSLQHGYLPARLRRFHPLHPLHSALLHQDDESYDRSDRLHLQSGLLRQWR